MSGGRAARAARRRWLIPEVVQTSAMDCGPAALKALLSGFDLPADYGRLRTACQTDVDGTSINTLEELAGLLGMDAEQVMVPRDHVLEHGSLQPSLVVVVDATGATHFVALWRSWGPFVQVMDPSRGRVWIHRDEFARDLYLHDALVPMDTWRTWAGTPEFLDPLRRRLHALGIPHADCTRAIQKAVADASWRGLGLLDAAVRMLTSLHRARALSRRELRASLRTLLGSSSDDDLNVIPDHCWSVQPSEDRQLHVRGAVLIRFNGRSANAPAVSAEPGLAALRAARPERPLRTALTWLRADGVLTPTVAAGAAALAVLGVVVEAAMLRSVLDIARDLRMPEQGLIAGLVLAAFSVALLCVEWVLGRAERQAGHHLEARLRIALFARIPGLPDAFLQSRPVSDLLERAHGIHLLRSLPLLGFRMLRIAMELAVIAAAIAWLAPERMWLAVGAVLTAIAIPAIGHRVLAARDLKVRTHAGALERFHLDALLGRTALEAHGAAGAIENEHEHLLREWTRASLGLQRGTVTVEAIQMLIGFSFAGLMLLGRLDNAETGGLLLLAYWMLNLPALGYELALYAREYPAQRNTLLRLLDVLNAPLRKLEATLPRTEQQPGIAIDFRQVQIKLGGRPVLDVDLQIRSGSHVAIVGSSGAGKSTLVGLLLGWYEPSHGELLVDGERVDPAAVQRLREETAWVDASVRVWNRSLLENLTYSGGTAEEIGPVLDAALLMPVLAKLPDGLSTNLGEGGSLLSAGEAQRVRLARAMLRRDARLIILDEPFVGLERDRRRALLTEARKRWASSTLLYVTHDVAEARAFDRVLLVEDGHIAEDGDPRVLAQTMGSRYRRLLHAQESAAGRFASSDWKRMRLEDGRLVQDYGNGAVEHSA